MGKEESDESVFAAAVNILLNKFPIKMLFRYSFLLVLNTFIIVLKFYLWLY